MLFCRTCLTRKDLSPLFGDKFAVFDSIQLFNATGLQIKENDGLPQTACKSCLRSIRKVLNFKEICTKSNEILKCINQNMITVDHRSIYDDVINGTESENPLLNGFDNDDDSGQNISHKIDIVLKTEINDVNEIPITRDKTVKTSKTLTKPKTENAETNNSNKKIKIKSKEIELSTENKITIEDLESTDSEPDKFCKEPKAIWTTEGRITDIYKHIRNKKQTATKFRSFGKRKSSFYYREKNETYMALAVTRPLNMKTPVECKKCHKVLNDRSTFLKHARTHFEPEFECEVCGKKFHSRNHMGYHQQRRHGSVKRLACTQCGFRAVDKTTLLNHMRLEHTGERPYICAECGLSFRMRRAIVQHMGKHFGVKNQQCDRCPAMFRSLSQLWTHQDRVHLMIHTYPCYLCQDTFKSRYAVKKHLLNIHGVPNDQQLKIECVKIKK